MQSQSTPFGFLIVLDRGDELLRSLVAFAREHDVQAAALYGIGAINHVELGFYDLAAKDYVRRTFHDELEVCALSGNLALLDDAPFPHVHGVFGRKDFTTIGGHIFEAVCALTLELAVHTVPVPIMRGPVDFCNLKLLKLEGT